MVYFSSTILVARIKSKMITNLDLFCNIILFVIISSAAQPLEAAQSWNCSTETDLCFLTPSVRLSWQEASAYCFQHSGGLSHSNDFKLISNSPIWSPSTRLWIGLGWIESRLQWMNHVPHEETNITAISAEARSLKMKMFEGQFCYYSILQNENKATRLMKCTSRLNFICVRPLTVKEEYFPKNSTFLEINSTLPELIPMGEFSRNNHSDLFLIEPSNESNFNLHCKVSNDTLAKCSKTHYRWLKNGAYKPDSDGKKNLFGDSEDSSARTDNNTLIANWLGKVACEIFCFSTGKTYRSEEILLSSPQFLIIRIDLITKGILFDLADAQIYIKNKLQNRLKDHYLTSKVVPVIYIDLPQFVPHVNKSSIDTFRFYAHFGPLGDDHILHCPTNILRNIDFIDELEQKKFGWITNITLSMVNYRKQAAINFLSCMTPFDQRKKRCVRIIPPQHFSKSITQCISDYQNDEIDASWDLSGWIKFTLDWLDQNKNLSKYSTMKFKELWLPVQRRTTLGPLWPVWPWNITSLQGSSWGDELRSIVNRSGLHADWSQLNASLSCLALDTESKLLKSVSCQSAFPMICVRPKLKWNESHFQESNRNFALRAQCPSGWLTSTLISDRNLCYRIFNGSETNSTNEAETECETHGARLPIVSQPSALAILLNIFSIDDLIQTLNFWIGLKRTDNGFKWIDLADWDYEKKTGLDIGNAASLSNDTYGISLNVLPEIANEIHPSSRRELKVWPKEPRFKAFICQKEIFPLQENVLQIRLDKTYRPEVLRRVKDLSSAEDENPIEFSMIESEMNKTSSADTAPSRLICFFGDSTSLEVFNSSDVVLNFKVLESAIPDAMEWLTAEISCETWDEWSPETIRASWIISGNPYGNASFSSLIVWLRHRTVNYSSEIHDSTFKASSSQRAAFKRSLHDMFVQEFVKLYPLYTDSLLSASDPVAFESEPFPNQQLLVKYRILINLNPLKEKKDGRGNPWSPDDQSTIMEDVRKFFSEKFNSSSDVRPPGTDLDFLSVRSTDFCHGEITSTNGEFIGFSAQPRNLSDELHWPQSTVGSRVASIPHCVSQDGFMLRRRCLGDRSSGLYWESLERNTNKSNVNGSLCIETSGLFQKLANINMDNSSQILETIRQNISRWNPIVAEVDLLGQTLMRSCSYISEDPKDDNLRNMVAIIKEIHDVKTDTLIGAQTSSPFSSNLAQATEKIMATINSTDSVENSTSKRNFPVKEPCIVAGSWNRANDSDVIGFTVKTMEKSIVEAKILSSYPTNEEIKKSNAVVYLPFQEIYEKEQVTFIAYPNTRLVDAAAASGEFKSKVFTRDASQPDGWSRSEVSYTGNSGMVQVHLNPAPTRLHKPIEILFKPKCSTTEEDKHLLRCVYWNEQMDSGNGGWSTDGCWYEGTEQNGMAICLCNHLSTFTLLVSRSEKELQCTVHGAILSVITLIGSSASILGLSLILATFVFFPSWRKPLGNKILFQLSAALIFLLLTFTLGANSVNNVDVCRLVAIFLHYFLLAGFCWMTVEAYHQYQRFVKVFGDYMPRFLLKASILAWGLPIVPIASVLIYNVDSYREIVDEGYCWLSDATAFYSAVLGPLVFLMLINLAIFVLVVRSIIAAGRGLRTNQTESKQMRDKLLASFLNFVLLGLTWIFGFFAIGSTNAVIFSYLFCVTSSLQGFIIFVLYVVRDQSARKLWLKCFGFGKSESRPMESKSKSALSKTTGNYESCSTTFTSRNDFTSTFSADDDVQYVEVVPFHMEVREAQREATTNII